MKVTCPPLAVAVGEGGGVDSTQGERISRSLGCQKVKRELLLIIHILCC
jgi:hypothetical protein